MSVGNIPKYDFNVLQEGRTFSHAPVTRSYAVEGNDWKNEWGPPTHMSHIDISEALVVSSTSLA